MEDKLVLVTGATGYIGGRLVPRLLESRYRVRVLVRDPKRLQGRPWINNVEVLQGDVFKPETLDAALEGIQAAYYLIHSMSSSDDFQERDLIAARNFGSAALHCCYVACGWLDGYWQGNARPYDVAAGLLLVQEAGGRYSDYDGRQNEHYRRVLVSNGLIHNALVELLKGHGNRLE